jgi:hypothetical protein
MPGCVRRRAGNAPGAAVWLSGVLPEADDNDKRSPVATLLKDPEYAHWLI